MQIVEIEEKVRNISGEITVPGDKSISHRSLLIPALTIGATRITGLLESEDVIATRDALISLGVKITRDGEDWIVEGVGLNAFKQPGEDIYCGNSGTSARLLMGLLATQDLELKFTGDASLQKRPMARVLKPISKFGVEYSAREETYMPLTIKGNSSSIGFVHELEVASAQVKSAIILGALNAYGETKITEPKLTRDHTEIMLKYLGFKIKEEVLDVGKVITVMAKQTECSARNLNVPADPSSAAFITALTLLADEGEVVIKNVCLNPHRVGFYEVVQLMGGDVSFVNYRKSCGEEVADIKVRASDLKACVVPASYAPRTIDEYPILAMLCAKAKGTSKLLGLEELKVKESNRLGAIYENLTKLGVRVVMQDDSLQIEGQDDISGEYELESFLDHRIAMSFIILGQVVSANLKVKGVEMIDTSFPGFFEVLSNIGGKYIWQK